MAKFLFSFILLCYLTSFSQNEPIYFDGFAQGTTYHINYYDEQNRFLKKEVDSILKDFDFSVSTYNHNSIISKINNNQPNVVLDNYFTTCFNKAKEVWKNTNGTFDPTVYPLVNAWGFGPEKKQNINKTSIDSILQFVGFEKIVLKNDLVIKQDTRIKLDFNAFAQGYSVDVVANYFNSLNITSYAIEIGGEVYAKGIHTNGDNWTIGIETPLDNKTETNPFICMVKLNNLAVATSGDYRNFFVEDGQKIAHHINPKTGYPTKNNLLSVSIFAEKCIDADANATGILVMGLEKAKTFLQKHKELKALLIYTDKKGRFITYSTPNLKPILVSKK